MDYSTPFGVIGDLDVHFQPENDCQNLGLSFPWLRWLQSSYTCDGMAILQWAVLLLEAICGHPLEISQDQGRDHSSNEPANNDEAVGVKDPKNSHITDNWT